MRQQKCTKKQNHTYRNKGRMEGKYQACRCCDSFTSFKMKIKSEIMSKDRSSCRIQLKQIQLLRMCLAKQGTTQYNRQNGFYYVTKQNKQPCLCAKYT